MRVYVMLRNSEFADRISKGLMLFSSGRMLVEIVSPGFCDLEEEPLADGFSAVSSVYDSSFCLLDTGLAACEPDAASLLLFDSYLPSKSSFHFQLWVSGMERFSHRRVSAPERIPNDGNASGMVSFLFRYYQRITGDRSFASNPPQVPVVSFASCYGGSGVTSLTLSTAHMLRYIYGSRVLYISMAPNNSSEDYFPASRRLGSDRFFLSLKRMEQEFSVDKSGFSLAPYISESGLSDHLAVGSLSRYAEEFSEVTIDCLLFLISEMHRYDYILFDLGSVLYGLSARLFLSSDFSIFVKDGRRTGFSSEREAEMRFQKRAGNMMTVVNFQEGETDLMSISDSPMNFVSMGGKIRIQVKGNYGLETAEIAKRIHNGSRSGNGAPISFGSGEEMQGEDAGGCRRIPG